MNTEPVTLSFKSITPAGFEGLNFQKRMRNRKENELYNKLFGMRKNMLFLREEKEEEEVVDEEYRELLEMIMSKRGLIAVFKDVYPELYEV